MYNFYPGQQQQPQQQRPMKTTFQSRTGFLDAQMACKQAGYIPIGQAQNKSGYFVVFGRLNPQSQPQQQNSMFGNGGGWI